MSYCINPNCPSSRQNPENFIYCPACGNDLLIQGRYRLVEPLGGLDRSRYFDVFEVDDRGISKVLKVMKNNHHQKYTELFEQEARILTRLRHPGIPKAESDGYFLWQLNDGRKLPCLIMEKIEGQNLEEWLQQNQRISANRLALNWLRQITEIIDYVHKNKFFHRDIKPSNIMQKQDGQLVLIDYGTAREITETIVNGRPVTEIISHGYTAQEQRDGKAVPQSDFFALGRTFVHLLTGIHPSSLQDSQTKQLIWHQRLAPEITEQLANLIDELMASSVQDRPHNTKIILQSLEKIERDLSAPSKLITTLPSPPPPPSHHNQDYPERSPVPPRPPHPKRYPRGVIFGLALILLVVMMYVWWKNYAPPTTLTACNSDPLDVSAIAFSPNGKYLAQVSLDNTVRVFDSNQLLKATSAKQAEVDCKSQEDGLVALKFSQDGTKIATASLDGIARLWTMNKNGKINSDNQRLSHERPDIALNYNSPVVALDFSGDGKFLATASSDGIVKVWDTSNIKQVASLNSKKYVRAISFSPDGKHLAIASLNNKARVWEWQADTKGEKPIPLPQDDVVTLAFSPTDSRYLATASADGIAQVWERDTTTFKKYVEINLENYPITINFSPDGKHLVILSLEDDKADLWEWEKNNRRSLGHDSTKKVVAVAFDPRSNWKYIATASDDGNVKVWRSDGSFLTNCDGVNNLVTIAFNPDGVNNLVTIAFNPENAGLLAKASANGNVNISKCQVPN